MTIPEKIDNIATQRQNQLPTIKNMQQQLHNVYSLIKQLEEIRKEANTSDSELFGGLFQQFPDIVTKLNQIDISVFTRKYSEINNELNKLEKRFSRERIHISFVGPAGQGKSLLMQRISGLSGNVIPSSDGGDCTGAKSTITNHEQTDVCAEITFYSVREYINIFNNYLKQIIGQTTTINSVEEIINFDLSSIQEVGAQNPLFIQLKKYIEHTSELVSFLGSTTRVPESEIENYVAQYSTSNPSQKYYKYLGVKGANILCKFPCSECGKIVLVDTIGLGAMEIGTRDKMLETVSNDSDAIFFMKQTGNRSRLDKSDFDTIRSIKDATSKEYASQMLYLIINMNNKNEDNKRLARKTVKTIDGQLADLAQDFIADKFEVDCSNRNEVENNLLIPVLNKISANLPHADQIILNNLQSKLQSLYDNYHDIAQKLQKARLKSISTDIDSAFKPHINHAYQSLTNNIRELYCDTKAYHYYEMRNKPCDKLKDEIDQKLNNILLRIPKHGEIVEFLNRGNINQHNVYEKLTDSMRLSIINDFIKINTTLHDLVTNMKKDIMHCLADEKHGRLAMIVPTNDTDPNEWFKQFYAILNTSSEDDHSCYDLIMDAINKLIAFDLSMENYMIYEVRACLDKIDISLTQPPELRGGFSQKEILIDDIDFKLRENLESVRTDIRERLQDLLSYPNNTLWAVIKDFYDRIVYANSELSDNKLSVQDEWEIFYRKNIAKIWPDEYKDHLAKAGINKDWNNFVNEINKYDNNKTFTFR